MSYKIDKFTGEKSITQRKNIQDAVDILFHLGIPVEKFNERQVRRVERLALVLLALGDIKPENKWDEIKSKDNNISLTTRDIIKFVNQYYSEKIADSSYDDFKRKEIDLLLLDGIIIPGFKRSATNDSRSGYCICPHHANAIKTFGARSWNEEVQKIINLKETLRKQISSERELSLVPITLPGGKDLKLSSGKHNELQKAIIEMFLPRYGFGADVLYVGDTTKKYLHVDKERLKELNLPEPEHEELPDIVAFSRQKNWLFLIESVTSFGEITPIRKRELEILSEKCIFPVIYITAFLNRDDYRKYCANLAWETEVWIASDPDHLIHLNGDKFLGPYS